jgi:hypothetical protein
MVKNELTILLLLNDKNANLFIAEFFHSGEIKLGKRFMTYNLIFKHH